MRNSTDLQPVLPVLDEGHVIRAKAEFCTKFPRDPQDALIVDRDFRRNRESPNAVLRLSLSLFGGSNALLDVINTAHEESDGIVISTVKDVPYETGPQIRCGEAMAFNDHCAISSYAVRAVRRLERSRYRAGLSNRASARILRT